MQVLGTNYARSRFPVPWCWFGPCHPCCLLALGISLALGSSSAKGATEPASQSGVVARDRYGDALPAGAIARFGTLRWRHAYRALSVAYSADGKVLASAGQGQFIRLWDAATGSEIRRIANPAVRASR